MAKAAPSPLVAISAVPTKARATATTSRRVGRLLSLIRYMNRRMAGMVYWSTVAVAALL